MDGANDEEEEIDSAHLRGKLYFILIVYINT